MCYKIFFHRLGVEKIENRSFPVLFGDWLKARRKALHLIQEELVKCADCSGFSLGKIESGEQRPLKQLAGLLDFALEIPKADHTCGLTIRANVDRLDPHGKVELSRGIQNIMAGFDALGACLFAGFGYAATLDGVFKRLLFARYGRDDLPNNILQELGKQTIKMEREFNRRAGFMEKDDRIPDWMTKEPLPPHNTVFDVTEEELDRIFEEIG
jgi:aldehyde:ferredoxin oxidoreductase